MHLLHDRWLIEDWGHTARAAVCGVVAAVVVQAASMVDAWAGAMGAAGYLALAFVWHWRAGMRGRPFSWNTAATFGVAAALGAGEWAPGVDGPSLLLGLLAIACARIGGILGARDAKLTDLPPVPTPELCPTCHYDQTGLPEGSPCPECGRVVEAV